MADLEALKRAAEAATPGPWFQSGPPWFSTGSVVLAGSPDPHVGLAIADAETWEGEREEAQENNPGLQLSDADADAAFIALANPATILDLISRLEEAEMALEAVAKLDVPRPVGTYWRADCKPTKNDKCAHGVWMYEECGECISDFAHAAHRRLKGGGDEA